ncbi:hypothetical protein [Ruegeria sp. EL01]|uniref:hypothetical protein n=1 Tax=Ruegeria sp. EL01 TaxID=2107578 RepID=UPI000EA80515|nr:hypothetical protein [Ruegeria sp. EL01]
MARDHVTSAAGNARDWTVPLGTKPRGEFERIAWTAGQNLRALAEGRAQIDYLYVPDVESLAALLRHAGPETQALRRRMMPRLAYRSRLWQGVHDRGEAYCFAACPVETRDLTRMQPHFPAAMVVYSIPKLVLRAGESFDRTSCPEDWDLGDREEIYVLCNIGQLEIEAGAEIRVNGNVLSLVVQNLGCGGGRISLGPTLTPVDRGPMGGFDGARGADGLAGADGKAGQSVCVASSVLGPVPRSIPASEDRDGQSGGDGRPGGAGTRGRPGGMCKSAEILVRDWTDRGGSLEIDARAGDGGCGGDGGRGGDGGTGGTPGRGHLFLTPPLADGTPGKGGRGGRGGDGGPAGHAGLGSHIFVETPKPNDVHVTALDGRPGNPGVGGRGGNGGASGATGPSSASGANGRRGRPGRTRPGPNVFVIEAFQGAKT